MKKRKHVGNSQTENDSTPHNTGQDTVSYFPKRRIWMRGILILSALVAIYYTSRRGNEVIFAEQKMVYDRRAHDVQCSSSYKSEIEKFKGCVPTRCGRVVSDSIISKGEVDSLLNIAKIGLSFGGSDGGASILDLHSGALSYGSEFVNFYKLPEAAEVIKQTDFITYKVVRTKIQHAIATHFGIEPGVLYLTHPTFFSKLTNVSPKTVHDEYWHVHVDKETYDSFHYTSLLYLNNYGLDFRGGRFIFVDVDNTSTIVEPRKGRVSMFTSGSENPHFVERVTDGTRYAITVSFTCDKKKAIFDPQFTGQRN